MRRESPASPGIATMCKALGDGTRLRIFEYLLSCCGPVTVDDSGDVRPVRGATVGQVCCRVTGTDRITSTISFHVKELRLAGLITVERQGKHMICTVNQDAVASLAAFFSNAAVGVTQPGYEEHEELQCVARS